MSVTPHRHQRGWHRKEIKQKPSNTYRNGNHASQNHRAVESQDNRAGQDSNRSRKAPYPISPRPSCSNETLPASSARSSSTNGSAVKEIPGFYYDPDKKRYFRLIPGHNNFNPLTRENLDKKRAETKRLEMLDNNKPNRKPHAGQCKHNFSLCPLQRSLQTGQLTSRQFTRYAQEQAISSLSRRPRKVDSFPHQYRTGASGDISFMQVDCKLRKLLMVFSDDSYSGIWQGTISCNPSNPRLMTIADWQVISVVRSRKEKITSASWISTPDTNDLQVLYSISGGLISTVQTMKCPDEARRRTCTHVPRGQSDVTFRYTSDHELAWTCAWDYNPLSPGYLSVGCSNKALILGTVTAENRKVFTTYSDVLAQTFATRTPVLYNGTRRGEILACDLRTLTGTRSDITQRLRHKVAVCSVRLLKDENYLVAGDMNGQIRLWDLRQCLCVREYKEHHNTHSHLPVGIDATENVLYAVGEDRCTRFWSLQDGHLLRTIPCPQPLTPIAPSVVYSQQWQSGTRGGLLLGVHQDLYWYAL